MTTVAPTIAPTKKPSQIVEMNWDPITRIVGSLGIYTKIDFSNRVVTECHATSSISGLVVPPVWHGRKTWRDTGPQ